MGILANISNFVDSVHQKQDNAKIKDVLTQHNYLTDPTQATDAINGVYDIDPDKGAALASSMATRNAAQNATAKSHFDAVTQYLRPTVDKGGDVGQAFDGVAPILRGMGYGDGELKNFRDSVTANPKLVYGADAKYGENSDKAMFARNVVSPGQHLFQGSQDIGQVAPKKEFHSIAAGGMGVAFDPGTGRNGDAALAPGLPVPGGTAGAGGAPPLGTGKVDAATLMPAIAAVESDGSGGYTARNKESGALGRYQVMPPTGRTLAARVGVTWRPDLMTSDTGPGRQYQDAIGKAAVQEAIDHTDNAADAARYYHGGSNRAGWKEKTEAYSQKVLGHLGMGGQDSGPSPVASIMDSPPAQAGAPGNSPGGGVVMGPPKVSTAAPKATSRPMTPDELKSYGLPDGTSAQIDSNGKATVLNKPSAQAQQASSDHVRSRDAALSGVQSLRGQLHDLANDPGLDSTLGLTGSIMSYLPGSHYHNVEGAIQQINAGKLTSLLQDARANGNPFGNRILKTEVDQLPKLLGNFNMKQSPADFRSQINKADAQLASMESRLKGPATGSAPAQGGGAPVGTVQHSPSTGRVRVMTPNGWQERN